MKTLTLIIAANVAVLASAAEITFEGQLLVRPAWTHTKTDGASTVQESFSQLFLATHTSGTNAYQMTSLVLAAGTLTNSASADIDLLDCVNSFGDAVTFARINILILSASSANIDPITISAPAPNGWTAWAAGTNALPIRPAGTHLLHAPDATGYPLDGTNGLLRITNTGTNAATYTLYLGGTQ